MIKFHDLSLYLLSEQDRDFYYQLYSNESLMHYITTPLTRNESDESFDLTLKIMSQPVPKLKLFVIKKNKFQEKLGVVGLRWNQKTPKTVEIGIVLKEKFHGLGFGHCAKKLLINQAFTKLGVNKIIAICQKGNKAANKANQKLNFVSIAEYLDETCNRIKIKWELINERPLYNYSDE